ncbi:MAG: hypothetical protein RLZZ86_205 [Cyanobacteriota bacterium]|jgi:hypothetical protein
MRVGYGQLAVRKDKQSLIIMTIIENTYRFIFFGLFALIGLMALLGLFLTVFKVFREIVIDIFKHNN